MNKESAHTTKHFSIKQRQIDAVGHLLITGIPGVQLVAGIVCRSYFQRIVRILYRLVKIDNGVECALAINCR